MMEPARLAMLAPSPEEENRLDLRSITAFADALAGAPLPPIGPETGARSAAPLRPDEPGECLSYPLPRLPLQSAGEDAL